MMKKNLSEEEELALYESGISIAELLRTITSLESRIKKLSNIIEAIWFKAGTCYSLLTVRKVGEDRIEELEKILD